MKAVTCAGLVRDRLRPEDLVVCGLGGTEAAFKQVGPVGPTYFASDPMGIWPSVALGLALARPDSRVVLLAGDGDLTMNLQVLITISATAPSNLRIVVFQNGTYASSGGQPLAAAGDVSIAGFAEAAGFGWAREVNGDSETEQGLDALFALERLGLLAVRLTDDRAPEMPPGPWSQVEERAFFMRSLPPA